jgi:hypothetical protein
MAIGGSPAGIVVVSPFSVAFLRVRDPVSLFDDPEVDDTRGVMAVIL